MKITIWIPVNDLSLNQTCIYHLREHHKIEYTAQNNMNFYTFISASGTPSSRKYICFWYTFLTQKVNLTKEKILRPPIYTINLGTRKRLHDILPIFDSLPRTRNINYNIQNMQHLFTFLAPRNLNRTTLELFFSLNQRLSIWPFGRRAQAEYSNITLMQWKKWVIVILIYFTWFQQYHTKNATETLKYPFSATVFL